METRLFHIILVIGLLLFEDSVCFGQKPSKENGWPVVTSESKPWTRWWWHGSAVTAEGITHELTNIAEAGFGGVEITPIYGAFGHEEEFINFLSSKWIEVLTHTLREGKRLGLGVDMATGTGWPFGGPWIGDNDACRNVKFKSYVIVTAADVPEKIQYVQEPLLRRVGFNIPGASHPADDDQIKHLNDPVHKNDHLQVLAIDQVRFEKDIPLVALIAYDEKKTPLDLTSYVNSDGKLKWKYPGGRWTLIGVFSGWHGKMVERAGPGGEGNVIDHFSAKALNQYLTHFDSLFKNADIQSLRAFFNDSYEVDDASGSADWTADLFDEFSKRRGYDLRNQLHELRTKTPSDTSNRVLCDYRETLSELLLENFTINWKRWAGKHGALVRNQAHGSPANILDLYAAVDIPEIEGEDPLRIKMASSAGNVTGKKLVAAEAATWLDEHFQSNLGEVKTALDRFLVNGVSHLVYHGTAYSPEKEPWPGWLFYAAVHFNDRNPFWRDLPALNQYVARCQSFLQNTTADNDVLLYYPAYDRFSTPGPELIEHFDGVDKQFEGTSFKRCAQALLDEGYAFDFISDRQINDLAVSNGTLRTSGNATYRTLVIAQCRYIPASTLSKIKSIADQGGTVIFFEGLPDTFSGFGNMVPDAKTFSQFTKSVNALSFAEQPASIPVGKGFILSGTAVGKLMTATGIKAEPSREHDIAYVRRKNGKEIIYFIVNNSANDFKGYLTFTRSSRSIEAYDPMTGQAGRLRATASPGSGTKAFLHLASKQSLILRFSPMQSASKLFPFYEESGGAIQLTSPWTVEFIEGGPTIPPPLKLYTLGSWTNAGPDYARYAGSARYVHQFKKPASPAIAWKLRLGVVCESASVYLNGKFAGTCLGPEYSVVIPAGSIEQENRLEVIVSNGMANRIAYMDRNEIPWKRFYNINFPARKPSNAKDGLFNAAQWAPAQSGLVGPVQLIPLKRKAAN